MNPTLNGETIMAISAAVVALVQLLKWAGVPAKYGPFTVLVFSAIGIGFWSWSTPVVLVRTEAWNLFAGWIAVATSAAGVFGFTRASGEALTSFRNP